MNALKNSWYSCWEPEGLFSFGKVDQIGNSSSIMSSVFVRRQWSHFPWPIQRSWCQWWGWWWRVCRWCHRSLFSLLTSTHTAVTVQSGIWFLPLTWLGQGGEAGGGISGYSGEQRAWGQICLLGEVNWLGGKVVRGERKRSGGGGTERRVERVLIMWLLLL